MHRCVEIEVAMANYNSGETMSKRSKQATPAHPPDAGKTAVAPKAIVDNETLRRLYSTVLTCRTVAARLPAVSAAAGATAQAAAMIELTAEDAVASSRDSLALDLLLGASLPAALANSASSSAPTNGTHPKLIARAGSGVSQMSVAAGVALAQKLEGRQGVVVALTDAASMSNGASYDALNYASANKVPMVVMVENTVAATGLPDFITIAQAHGVPAFVVDGKDAVAVYRVSREALNRARSGRGPSLIECRKFETSEDPLRHLERYLEKHGLWTPKWKKQLLANVDGELRRQQ
jgi:TPP-dependent pyruvate/acetoin dehydrogenase alpha subunit